MNKLEEKSIDQSGPLWAPSYEQITNANVMKYMSWLKAQAITDVHNDWDRLYEWSVTNMPEFWNSLWDYFEVIGMKGEKPYHLDEGPFFKRRFFPNAKLNYAENMLRWDLDGPAIIFQCEDIKRQELSWSDLRLQVARLRQYLKVECGIKKGDRVAGYIHSGIESVIGFLATTSLGAIWSTCSPDFGERGVLDRFEQIEPKVIIVIDGYVFKKKAISLEDKNQEILKNLPSVKHIICCTVLGAGNSALPGAIEWSEIIDNEAFDSELEFEAVEFDHPLAILFSSGTTGSPKCIVHGHGGLLLQHLKEHRLHCDIKPSDRLFYFTTTGWMMWNWLVAGLGSGATIVMYEGSPFEPNQEVLFDLIDREKITFFGVSAKYIDALAKANLKPSKTHDLSTLRTIGSTGSPLVQESFRYVYSEIKADVNLASLSGGTDIASCFALGCFIKPVYIGELQSRGLGLAVDVFDSNGKSVIGEKGELVCTKPFPCMPVKFWNDPGNQKYQKSYFDEFEDVWTHGDFSMITEHGGLVIYGRSDAVLNPGGVRIGTAEIYRQVEKIKEIEESIAVGQSWDEDMRVILFVKMKRGETLTDELIAFTKSYIRQHASPRHVPAKIIAVDDIPRTRSNKIVELAVTDVIHGREVKNKASLANPEALEFYRNLPELRT